MSRKSYLRPDIEIIDLQTEDRILSTSDSSNLDIHDEFNPDIEESEQYSNHKHWGENSGSWN